MNTRHILAGTLACSVLWSAAARAQQSVVDYPELVKWGQQATQMGQTITQLKSTVQSLTNVPQSLTSQVEGLLNSTVQNPLGAITRNIKVLMTGQGTGSCAGSQTVLTQNQYSAATGGDFLGQSLNQSANRNAGLMACTQQMLQATQARLQQMPQLLTMLQGSTDVTSATVNAARIQQEIGTINAQQQQAMLMAQSSMLQHMMSDDQLLQKQRADAQEVIRGTSAGAPGGIVPTVTVQPYSAGGN